MLTGEMVTSDNKIAELMLKIRATAVCNGEVAKNRSLLLVSAEKKHEKTLITHLFGVQGLSR